MRHRGDLQCITEHLNHKVQVQVLKVTTVTIKNIYLSVLCFIFLVVNICEMMRRLSTKTYNQSCCVHVIALHQKLSHMLTLQAFQSDKLRDCPTGLAIFAGHDRGEVRPAGVQVEGLLRSDSRSWNMEAECIHLKFSPKCCRCIISEARKQDSGK